MTKFSDGDTVWVTDAADVRHKVRLDRIDAPESDQPYGKESAAALKAMVDGREVRVEYRKCDQYGRMLGILFINGTDINLAMVKGGHAWHYSYYDKIPEYAAAEVAAREAKMGLWAGENPINPYRWRKGERKAADSAPVCDKWPEMGYWYNTNTGVRHNRNCPNYRKTRGYPCQKDEGRPCGKCGG